MNAPPHEGAQPKPLLAKEGMGRFSLRRSGYPLAGAVAPAPLAWMAVSTPALPSACGGERRNSSRRAQWEGGNELTVGSAVWKGRAYSGPGSAPLFGSGSSVSPHSGQNRKVTLVTTSCALAACSPVLPRYRRADSRPQQPKVLFASSHHSLISRARSAGNGCVWCRSIVNL